MAVFCGMLEENNTMRWITRLPSSFTNETVYRTDIKTVVRSNIQSVNDINSWIQEFGHLTQTKWNVRSTYPSAQKFICSKRFVCHHSSFLKVERDKNGKGLSKNSACPALIDVKVKLNTMSTRRKDEYIKKGLLGVITIYNNHNHSLGTADTLHFLPAHESIRRAFIEYFDQGMGIAEACRYHEGKLELDQESTEEMFASGTTNPSKRTVRYWHDQWRLLNLGPRTGTGLVEKIKEKQKAYEELGISVIFKEDPFAVAIITPLMKRAHKLLSSQEIAFVDSTSACDSLNHSVTFMLTPCAAGAVPLGILITRGQTFESYAAAFSLLRDGVINCFNGQKYPNVFLTDNSQAEIAALKSVWPQSRNLLCIFHVCQAVWRWLWNCRNNIRKEDRQKLMLQFQEILYSHSTLDAEAAFKHTQELGNNYSNWQNYLLDYWNIREQWCLAWRDPSSRGHHTNNFSEVCVRIFKDTVLSRVKAYNVIALIDFSCTVLEKYYCNRLREFANSRTGTAKQFLHSMMKRASYVKYTQIEKLNENEFLVPSEQSSNEKYCVNVRGGYCSCTAGQYGKFCKHQCAVYRAFAVTAENFPPVTSLHRHQIAFLALGDKTPSIEFYQPFMQGDEVPTVASNATTADSEIQQCEVMDCTADSDNKLEETTIIDVCNLLHTCNDKFGSSLSGLRTLKNRIEMIRSQGQWESFLHTAGSSVPARQRDGVPIRVQPTSLARRSASVTKGSKRLPSGRPAAGEQKIKKRKRLLGLNIKQNHPNAKSHGKSH